MSYRRAEEILPLEMIELIQQYVDGESIYIPRREENRVAWGTKTDFRAELTERNRSIFADYECGMKVSGLAVKYCLSEKSIQRIVRQMKL